VYNNSDNSSNNEYDNSNNSLTTTEVISSSKPWWLSSHILKSRMRNMEKITEINKNYQNHTEKQKHHQNKINTTTEEERKKHSFLDKEEIVLKIIDSDTGNIGIVEQPRITNLQPSFFSTGISNIFPTNKKSEPPIGPISLMETTEETVVDYYSRKHQHSLLLSDKVNQNENKAGDFSLFTIKRYPSVTLPKYVDYYDYSSSDSDSFCSSSSYTSSNNKNNDDSDEYDDDVNESLTLASSVSSSSSTSSPLRMARFPHLSLPRRRFVSKFFDGPLKGSRTKYHTQHKHICSDE
jgi:hypothetical protein